MGQKIRVIIGGGQIVAVFGLPAGHEIEIRDYDVEWRPPPPEIVPLIDADGKRFLLMQSETAKGDPADWSDVSAWGKPAEEATDGRDGTELVWGQDEDDPNRWVLGMALTGPAKSIIADVRLQRDGVWFWGVVREIAGNPPVQYLSSIGCEPTKNDAMNAAERYHSAS